MERCEPFALTSQRIRIFINAAVKTGNLAIDNKEANKQTNIRLAPCSRVLLDKLFCGTQSFITTFTRVVGCGQDDRGLDFQ